MEKDVLGKALHDYWHGDAEAHLLVHTSYGPVEVMPAQMFFRDEPELPPLEQYALSLCKGKVLDAGAGAGSHSLLLQKQGLHVIALDISPLAVQVMQERGVQHAIQGDIFDYKGEVFDTILLLMNGIGIAQNLKKLPDLLSKFKELLHPGGQLLLDSCDVSYLTEYVKPAPYYIGEITYQFEYNHQEGKPFGWLYLDSEKLNHIASDCGWHCQVIYQEENGQYLARLVVR